MTDNVRQVFSILDIKPNERFKIEGSGDTVYHIDESLYTYREGIVCGGLNLLINGDLKIIKLPKEPKKKKLRDLTKKEYEKWQENNCGKDNPCYNCLFKNIPCHSFIDVCWINHKDLYSDKFLDQEIEVEE